VYGGHSAGKVPEVLVRPRLPKAMVRVCVLLPESGVKNLWISTGSCPNRKW